MFTFENTYSQLPQSFYERCLPDSQYFSELKLFAFNYQLAKELGSDAHNYSEEEILKLFSGKNILKDSSPMALVYAGHQFGHFNPRLGDGRAVLLGEVNLNNGKRFDIQLKGSGRTPYSRRGDGKSPLGSVIREYIMSEAMHALDVPTTRALCALSTGEVINRHSSLPAGIFTRVASSHIRVGTFEYFASRINEIGNLSEIKALADYVIKRHYPACSSYQELFSSICEAQAKLVSKWISLGFIHGVMNTDNMTVSGETIDYGPCAFMDHFKEDQVYSSIDRYGRYAYNQQEKILLWNLSSLGNCLSVLISNDQEESKKIVMDQLQRTKSLVQRLTLELMSKKLGITPNEEVVESWLSFIQEENKDFTNAHLDLMSEVEGTRKIKRSKSSQKFFNLWEPLIKLTKKDIALERMKSVNPQRIPRNHQVEKAIAHGLKGDNSHFERMLEAIKSPYTKSDDYLEFEVPPKEHEVVHETFCGT